MTFYPTHKDFAWLPGYLETVSSAELWKPITVASIARQYRQLLHKYAIKTGAPLDFCLWQGHDFSARGMSGIQDAFVSGSGHLLSFLGTDTIGAIDYLEDFYGGKDTFVGGSVPATEHAVMCMGGKDDEYETIRRLIEDVYPAGIVSVVSDTWNFWKVVGEGGIAEQLKDKILARKPNALGQAKTVFRPDSGDPVRIITGYRVAELKDIDETNYYKYDAVSENGKVYEFEISFVDPECTLIDRVSLGRELSKDEVKGAVECLWDTFGGTTTEKGYKVLNERVGLIYGDSITLHRAEDILERLEAKGFASCNIVFGIGSYTYQYITRDTFGIAVKSTFGVVNGEDRELSKDPITDSGTKKSATGLLRVEREGNDYVLYQKQTWEQEAQGALEEVFRDGKLVRFQTLVDMRKRLEESL